MQPPSTLCACFVLLVGAAGCATTEQQREAVPSSFLGDTSLLEPGGEGQALLVWIDSSVDWASYDQLIVDPVTVWRWSSSTLDDVSAYDGGRLAAMLQLEVEMALADDYLLTTVPGPRTLRLRTAITEAEESVVSMDIVSMVVPIGLLATGVKRLAEGTHTFVGQAGVEMEILDSQSGRRLAAGMDRRVGGKTFEGVTNSWSDVEQAFKYWADRLRDRLQRLRIGR
jgi:hypothetical protein